MFYSASSPSYVPRCAGADSLEAGVVQRVLVVVLVIVLVRVSGSTRVSVPLRSLNTLYLRRTSADTEQPV